MNSFSVIDEATWERAVHCNVFRDYLEPFHCTVFEVDITNYKDKVKELGLSFTLAMVHAMCSCANSIENFRYRFLDGEVVLFDEIDTAFAYLNKETQIFKVVNVPLKRDLVEYCSLAKETAEEQKEYFTGPLGTDIFMCSPIPWITFTQKTHTISGKKDSAMPNLDWGKYYEKDGRYYMPISVSAHHSFVDGYHVGLFAEKLQEYLHCILQ